jgi:hypothetical protein
MSSNIHCFTKYIITDKALIATDNVSRSSPSCRKKITRRKKPPFFADQFFYRYYLPKQIKFKSPHKPLCHQFSSRSNSSTRVQIAKHILINSILLTNAGKVTARTIAYCHSKMQKIQQFEQLVLTDDPSYDAKEKFFYVTDTFDDYFETMKMSILWEKNVTILHVASLRLIDTNDGCGHNVTTNPTFIKIPRSWSLTKATNVSTDAAALHRLLKGHKLQRGCSHLHVARNYRTFGMFCPRNSKGVVRKEGLKTANILPEDNEQLRYMYSRANELCLRVLPTAFIRGVREAHKYVQWETMGQNVNHAVTNTKTTSHINLWAAAAASKNYQSASHIDSDFFYSALTVVCHDDIDVTEKVANYSVYRKKLPPAIYFCLPKKGVAIAMRPGDYILFNPTEPHCVSMREKFYEKKHVFVLSFFLKSAVVGKNDNSMSNHDFDNCDLLNNVFQRVG